MLMIRPHWYRINMFLATFESLLQKELSVLSEWLVDNILSLHLGKTWIFLFGNQPKLKFKSGLCNLCKDIVIEAKVSV